MKTLVLCAALAAACAEEPTATPSCPAPFEVHPQGEPFRAPAEPDQPVRARFRITIDPTAPALAGPQREPQASAAAIERLEGDLDLRGGVKRFAKHADRLWVELYLIQDGDFGLRDARATVDSLDGAAQLRDLGTDPFAEPTSSRELLVGGLAPEGIARLRFGLDVTTPPQTIQLGLTVSGRATHRTAANSTPIQVTPDGAEVWSVQGDADVLSVLSAADDRRIAQVPAAGRPTSLAITPDGRLVLATCARCNQLVVIDRAARKVVQILGEDEGIGREPRQVVISPEGERAYVSAYVGDTVTALERTGDRFRVLGTVVVGRRPTGLSVTPDGATVFVAHHLPRGPIEDNEAWVTTIDAASVAVVAEPTLRDDGNAKEAACLTQIMGFQSYSAEDLSFEATPTQLAGVFLSPSGDVGWVPALRVAGFPIFEGDVSALGFQFLSKGANSPSMLFPLDTRAPRDAGFRKTPGIIDITDRDESFLRCVPASDDSEGVRARPGSLADERTYAGVTIPSASTLLDETGVSRFVGFSRGGRRVLVLSYVADELAVLDGATHSPVAQHHLRLAGSNPVGLAVTPDGRKAYVA